MVFTKQPKKEGEEKDCENCDIPLIARWTDYKGKYDDKLQWQTIEPRKSHYEYNGNCKDVESKGIDFKKLNEENNPNKIELNHGNIASDTQIFSTQATTITAGTTTKDTFVIDSIIDNLHVIIKQLEAEKEKL